MMKELKHIFVNVPLMEGKSISLPKEIAHRLTRVLRCKIGYECAVFNGKDGLFKATLSTPTSLDIYEQFQQQPEAHIKALYVCLPKKETFSRILRQATEMNVSDIYPLFSDYTVPDKLNLERCQAILVEAAEQCERLTLPILHEPQQLREVSFSFPTLWAAERAHMREEDVKLTKAQALLVGAEGGFSPEEVNYLKAQSALQPLSLGETILRTDTAVIAGLACL